MSVSVEKLASLIILLGKSPGVSNLGKTKLWKLIYFIDVEFLREYGRTLTGSEYIKYDHGPVPSKGERQLKKLSKAGSISVQPVDYGTFLQNHVQTVMDQVFHAFDKKEMDVINRVCERLGSGTATFLSELSHREPAWLYADPMGKLSEELMFYGHSEDEDGL